MGIAVRTPSNPSLFAQDPLGLELRPWDRDINSSGINQRKEDVIDTNQASAVSDGYSVNRM